LEIYKLNEINDVSYLKFKKIEGNVANFREVNKSIIVKLNY